MHKGKYTLPWGILDEAKKALTQAGLHIFTQNLRWSPLPKAALLRCI